MSTIGIGVTIMVLCAVVEGFAQVFLKKSAMSTTRSKLYIAFAILAFIVNALMYTKALLILDVSIAYPLGSLSFIAVTVLSQWLLKEKVTPRRWLGVLFILFGVGLVVAQA